jgi:epoxyqueuosine reductase
MGIFRGQLTGDGYQPPFIHRLLSPRVSGNTINGLGESEPRRPRRIYHWCYLKRTIWYPHYLVNLLLLIKARIFYRAFYRIADQGLDEQRRELRSVAPTRQERSPQEWTDEIKKFARSAGADLVGIVRADPLWIVDGCGDVPGRWLIMLGFRMEYEEMEFDRDPDATIKDSVGMETIRIYLSGQRIVNAVIEWIHERGWQAQGSCGPAAGGLTLIPPAIAAGFGELGKHGSIINREFGSGFRLGYVAVDIPLISDELDSFGADDFCTRCKVCSDACPPSAIVPDKQLVRGDRKWYVDFDKCVPYFNEELGCGVCITVCPWTRPGVAPRLTEKLRKREELRASVSAISSRSTDKMEESHVV